MARRGFRRTYRSRGRSRPVTYPFYNINAHLLCELNLLSCRATKGKFTPMIPLIFNNMNMSIQEWTSIYQHTLIALFPSLHCWQVLLLIITLPTLIIPLILANVFNKNNMNKALAIYNADPKNTSSPLFRIQCIAVSQGYVVRIERKIKSLPITESGITHYQRIALEDVSPSSIPSTPIPPCISTIYPNTPPLSLGEWHYFLSQVNGLKPFNSTTVEHAKDFFFSHTIALASRKILMTYQPLDMSGPSLFFEKNIFVDESGQSLLGGGTGGETSVLIKGDGGKGGRSMGALPNRIEEGEEGEEGREGEDREREEQNILRRYLMYGKGEGEETKTMLSVHIVNPTSEDRARGGVTTIENIFGLDDDPSKTESREKRKELMSRMKEREKSREASTERRGSFAQPQMTFASVHQTIQDDAIVTGTMEKPGTPLALPGGGLFAVVLTAQAAASESKKTQEEGREEVSSGEEALASSMPEVEKGEAETLLQGVNQASTVSHLSDPLVQKTMAFASKEERVAEAVEAKEMSDLFGVKEGVSAGVVVAAVAALSHKDEGKDQEGLSEREQHVLPLVAAVTAPIGAMESTLSISAPMESEEDERAPSGLATQEESTETKNAHKQAIADTPEEVSSSREIQEKLTAKQGAFDEATAKQEIHEEPTTVKNIQGPTASNQKYQEESFTGMIKEDEAVALHPKEEKEEMSPFVKDNSVSQIPQGKIAPVIVTERVVAFSSPRGSAASPEGYQRQVDTPKFPVVDALTDSEGEKEAKEPSFPKEKAEEQRPIENHHQPQRNSSNAGSAGASPLENVSIVGENINEDLKDSFSSEIKNVEE